MITIKIGGAEQEWDRLRDSDEGWISQQFVRRRAAGERPCVRLGFTTPSVNIGLSTPDCSTDGGGRRATYQEERIFALWREHGLDDPRFNSGNLIAFLTQLGRWL